MAWYSRRSATLLGTTATLWLLMVRRAKAFNGEGSCQSIDAHVSLFMALFKMRIMVWSMLWSATSNSSSL